MYKLIRLQIAFIYITILFSGCGNSENKSETKERPMVYEGMPSADLENVIGNPNRIDSTETIFDANTGKKIKVEKWYYDKRTVVIINDTVITPSFASPD